MERIEETKNVQENHFQSTVREITDKLKGMTYSTALKVLEYVKFDLKNNLTLN